MNYKLINEKLKDISTLRRGKCVEKSSKDEYGSSSHYEIYQIEGDLYVKLSFYSDSYGEEETITSIAFVSPQKVQVTNFIDVE